MSSYLANRNEPGRSAAVLTTAEVAASTFSVNSAWASKFAVDLSFTIGSLTNCAVRFYGSVDGVTQKPVAAQYYGPLETLTASAERLYVIDLPGIRYAYVTLQGTGTTTSSSATVVYRYLAPASQ